MMLLGTQLFADKSGNRIHIRWLPYVARLEEMGRYSWGSAALAWLYRCMCRVANRHVVKLAGPLQLLQSWIFWRFPTLRPSGYDEISWPLASRWSGYNPGISNKEPRVQMARLKIDLLQPRQVSTQNMCISSHCFSLYCPILLIFIFPVHMDAL
ncbi:protein MAIN-LIKE 1-like [Arachis ipaensis]|uniref:protein MAIN-LIKE 1-like n=1 Tax=Arachis ipaensis TaxID=130454 RepID=UPI000A2B5505|nr:protein MAIN-LIKE 1-like [Arachis ipaensis]